MVVETFVILYLVDGFVKKKIQFLIGQRRGSNVCSAERPLGWGSIGRLGSTT
jgi:hypothetical protein